MKELLKWCFRGAAGLLTGVCLLLAGGDGDPICGKTEFEGWERPLPLPAPCETEGRETTSETDMPIESHTVPKNPPDTIPQPSEHTLRVTLGEGIRVQGETGVLYPLYLQGCPQGDVFGLLVVIEGAEDSEIYAVTPGELPPAVSFYHLIKGNRAGILLDGPAPSEGFFGAVCYLAVEGMGKSPAVVKIETAERVFDEA